jgi:toxin ParE1/3/4
MPTVEYSPKALLDLQQLNDYLSTNWGENTSRRILKKITSDIRRLELYSLSGVDLGKLIDVSTDYRYLFSEKNYIFYRLESDKIRIIRILNEHQDFMKQLFGISSDIYEN